ncbi:hypothetical protein FNV43_RR22828 [Rhamnella rubrinervis]|uniref:SANT domain-containing protein n=1 Tax=Rhamnella rubrinervis TaxID=2594499 RepID=A0A8K0DVZ6_9ROSA|nr:hypothetical protein FNV43_RR22828 [Rhamnella rubrinervis]
MDSFDDLLFEPATTHARVGGKFRPKAKLRPRKELSASVPTTVTSDATGKNEIVSSASLETADPAVPVDVAADGLEPPVGSCLDTVQSVQSVDLGKSRLADQGEPSLATSETVGRREPPKTIEDPCSGGLLSDSSRSLFLGNSSQSLPADALDSEVAVLDGDWHSSFGKPVGENADIFSELEYLDDFLTQPTSGTASDATKSHIKDDMDVEHGNKLSKSFCANNDGNDSSSHSEMATHLEESFGVPVHGSIDSSAFVVCNAAQSPTCSDYHTTQVLVSCNGSSVSDKHDDEVQIGNGRSETKASGALLDFDTLDTIFEDPVASGQRAGKFQPKPKLKMGEKKPTTGIPTLGFESAKHAQDSHLVSLETGYVHEGSIPQIPSENPSENMHEGTYGDSVALGPSSEIHRNAEPTNLAEIGHSGGDILGDVMPSEDVAGMFGEVGSTSETGKASTASSPPRKRKLSSTSKGVKGRKSSRQQRTGSTQQLVDEAVDEACEPPNISNPDVDCEPREDTSQKKKATRKPKKPVSETDKSAHKHKGGNVEPDQPTEEPRKKFSHSTRRNKRQVDKDLLDMPEDEIDPQKLSIKNLILLAEHRESLVIKEASKSKTPQANQSAESSFHEEASHNRNESSASEQGRDSDDDQATCRVQPSSSYVNYQSFMNKTPYTRWSEQDTELFYEAVRQFGTDFSLIQQLFPGRTRHQIKLKYNKEWRQHPLRLSEALTKRAKDNSHFKSVIERLQQVSGQEKQEYNEDESNGVAWEEAEVAEKPTHNTNEGATKSELDDEFVRVQEAEDGEVHSPLKEDGSDTWGDYNY